MQLPRPRHFHSFPLCKTTYECTGRQHFISSRACPKGMQYFSLLHHIFRRSRSMRGSTRPRFRHLVQSWKGFFNDYYALTILFQSSMFWFWFQAHNPRIWLHDTTWRGSFSQRSIDIIWYPLIQYQLLATKTTKQNLSADW